MLGLQNNYSLFPGKSFWTDLASGVNSVHSKINHKTPVKLNRNLINRPSTVSKLNPFSSEKCVSQKHVSQKSVRQSVLPLEEVFSEENQLECELEQFAIESWLIQPRGPKLSTL